MGAEVIILFNPYTYNFLKGLTHSAMGEVRMYKFGEDPDRLPGGKYTGKINFIASHFTSVLWQATFSFAILAVQ